MTHDMEYTKQNEDLRKYMVEFGLDIQMSHDGLCIPLASL